MLFADHEHQGDIANQNLVPEGVEAAGETEEEGRLFACQIPWNALRKISSRLVRHPCGPVAPKTCVLSMSLFMGRPFSMRSFDDFQMPRLVQVQK